VPVDVFLCAGEASGDLQASLLVKELRERMPHARFAAIGGEHLRAAGAQIWIDSVAAGWASVGPLGAYVRIPWLLMLAIGLVARLFAARPKLIVCVDFGAFNLRLLLMLRAMGYKGRALYYFPPGAWLDDVRQARRVARVASALTPFTRQAELYRRAGLPIAFFGHPLAASVAPRPARAVGDPPHIAVLPGSRPGEIAQHIGVLANAALLVRKELGATFGVVAATRSIAERLRSAWPADCGGADAVAHSDASTAVAGADVAWCASGTATLETALRGVPEIVFYRVSDAQYRLAERTMAHLIHGPIALPNLVTGRVVVPELLQYDFEPRRLADLTRRYLTDEGSRRAMLAGFEEMRAKLGPPDSLTRIGDFAARLVEGAPRG